MPFPRSEWDLFHRGSVALSCFLLLCLSCSPPSFDKLDFIRNYSNIVFQNYLDAHNAAVDLDQNIVSFIESPSEENLEKCKAAWRYSRISYCQSEAFRFYGGPIDDEDGVEAFLNAWPVDESFIDYVVENPSAGLISDSVKFPEIAGEILLSENERASETSIFTGYHAIEFLLWGQDLSEEESGNRSFKDYVVDTSNPSPVNRRRAQYLGTVSKLLVKHLKSLVDEWSAQGSYRQKFNENLKPDLAVRKIVNGMAVFTRTELAGERMYVAVETGVQEHETSCFSDNSLRDLKMNFVGIKNVFVGTYGVEGEKQIEGIGLKDLLEESDRVAIEEVIIKIDQSFTQISEPFDQAIRKNPDSIKATVRLLRELSSLLSQGSARIK